MLPLALTLRIMLSLMLRPMLGPMFSLMLRPRPRLKVKTLLDHMSCLWLRRWMSN
jgi:hypothetical protein